MAHDNKELVIEHFEFAPISIIDEVIDSVNELLYQALIGLENFIYKYLNSDEEIEQ
ncbi:2546_t:CDS:1, partial [Dentiscutata erythropus]